MSDFLLDIPNVCTPGSGLCTGGRPRPEHLASAARQGVKMVVNLCPPAEAADYDEAAVVAGLGMRYVNIPVAGPADLTLPNVKALAHALEAGQQGAGDRPAVLLHCASGNRAGAMLALKAAWVDGKPAAEALAIGRAAGLTALDGVVSHLLAG
ncbi:MAG: sulfur transferase domain-containing protein [Moraxellaceae bacterium]|nr:sulfur transferase domain-containing protein [Moraxellaceae bacterium]